MDGSFRLIRANALSRFHTLLVAGSLMAIPTTGSAAEWKDIPVSGSRLVSVLPELANALDTVARVIVGGPPEVRQEMILFGAAPGLPPVAQLLYAEIQPHSTRIFTDEDLPPIEEQVKTIFAEIDAVIGETGDVKNVVGEGHYARYRASVLDCVFFRVHDGYVPADAFLLGGVSANILGRMRVMGWYCAVPGTELTDDEASRFIQSVGVRGYAVPERP